MKKIILASTSPYRKALLNRLMIHFECSAPNVDEDLFKAKISDPYELAHILSYEKANAIAKDNSESIVIGSDQLAHLNGEILGKPKTFEKAFEQLKKLSGKTHELITAVSIIHLNQVLHFTNITKLDMRALSDEQIKNYLKKDGPFDCAGSYKLELHGISLFKTIDTTDQTAIVGLPLLDTAESLSKLGIEIPGRF